MVILYERKEISASTSSGMLKVVEFAKQNHEARRIKGFTINEKQ
jgi:hypothetical protein